jgi:1,6-anhydro-N-acetylmuramate kinase
MTAPLLPSCCARCAVSVDGVPARTYVPREQDPGGWFTAASNAPPDAPFNQPFYLIL